MRFRLLKYCCRIWDMNLAERPTPSELRPIVPLVFYQGERTWSYSTEFADLFAESVRDWPWGPRFRHELIDQSGMQPEEAQGDLKARLMQLLLLAAYHPSVAWMEQVAESLVQLGGNKCPFSFEPVWGRIVSYPPPTFSSHRRPRCLVQPRPKWSFQKMSVRAYQRSSVPIKRLNTSVFEPILSNDWPVAIIPAR
jgi:hypothetical protein